MAGNFLTLTRLRGASRRRQLPKLPKQQPHTSQRRKFFAHPSPTHIAPYEVFLIPKTTSRSVCDRDSADGLSSSSTINKIMAYPATPQRPLPGAYFATPAASRFNTGPPVRQPLFPQGVRPAAGPNPIDGHPNPQSRELPAPRALPPVQRAANTINEVLKRDANFPEIDTYVRRKYAGPFLHSTQLTMGFRRGHLVRL